MARIQPEASNRSPSLKWLLPLVGALVLTAWVQRHGLAAFFSSPDDLVHLQQAAGLRPTLPSPFRFLSQVLYFRVMYGLVGLDPRPFHLFSLWTHLVNVGLLFYFFRRNGVSTGISALAVSLFGAFPLFYSLMASAVGMNDELALTFTLVALILVGSGGVAAIVAAGISFIAAVLCKESVLALPLVVFALRLPPTHARARRTVLLVLAVAFTAAFLAVPPQGLSPYAVELHSNVFHNFMTYLSWSVDLVRPIPDLVSSFDPKAWLAGVSVCAAVLLLWVFDRADRSTIQLAAIWFLAGLLPVLPLKFQTYRHYLYPALPGLALLASVAVHVPLRLVAGRALGDGSPSIRRRSFALRVATVAIPVLIAVAYSTRSNFLITERMKARVPGTILALDPVVRRQEVAGNAIASIAQSIRPGESVKLAVFSPEGTARVFGARTGREYTQTEAVRPAYSLLQAALDEGRAVKLFFPSVDTVAFISRWTPQLEGYEMYLAHQGGLLLSAGAGPASYQAVAQWLLEHRLYAQGAEFLDSVLMTQREDPSLRVLYASALFKVGERERALDELRRVVASDSGSEAGRVAAHILRSPPGDTIHLQKARGAPN